MAGAYSTDLRERVLAAVEAAVEAGEAVPAVARRFAVGRSTVQDWVRAWRREGRRGPGKMGGHLEPQVSGDAEAALRRLLEGANPLTLAQCRDRLAEKAGVSAHPSTNAPGAAAHGLELEKSARCARPSRAVTTWPPRGPPGTRILTPGWAGSRRSGWCSWTSAGR